MSGFQFSQNWFDADIPNLKKCLSSYIGHRTEFLEIGSFEGRSTVWFLSEILTHPKSRITCVDWFRGSAEHKADLIDVSGLEDRFTANITLTGSAYKVRKIIGRSQEVLRTLPLLTFDIAYIDGSHTASDVLEDAVLSFGLVKSGGLILFDDYEWPRDLPEHQKPKLGIDAFLHVYAGQYTLLLKSGQVYIRKN
jgi:predicted O-methyltransferase YrrM